MQGPYKRAEAGVTAVAHIGSSRDRVGFLSQTDAESQVCAISIAEGSAAPRAEANWVTGQIPERVHKIFGEAFDWVRRCVDLQGDPSQPPISSWMKH